MDRCDDTNLPSVNDLEVAASAASEWKAFLKPSQILDNSRTKQQRTCITSSESESESESGSDIESETSSSECDGGANDDVKGGVKLRFVVDESNSGRAVKLELDSQEREGKDDMNIDQDAEQNEVDLGTDSSEEGDRSDVEILDAETDMNVNLDDIRKEIDSRIESRENGTESEALAHPWLPVLEPLKDMTINSSDNLDPAGELGNMVNGMVLVQAHVCAKVLEIGSLLCLQDRTVVGRVQDIFGPVESPFYVVEYSGHPEDMDKMQKGEKVFSVARHTSYVDIGKAMDPRARDVGDEDGDGESSSEDEELKNLESLAPPGWHAQEKAKRSAAFSEKQKSKQSGNPFSIHAIMQCEELSAKPRPRHKKYLTVRKSGPHSVPRPNKRASEPTPAVLMAPNAPPMRPPPAHHPGPPQYTGNPGCQYGWHQPTPPQAFVPNFQPRPPPLPVMGGVQNVGWNVGGVQPGPPQMGFQPVPPHFVPQPPPGAQFPGNFVNGGGQQQIGPWTGYGARPPPRFQ